MQGNFGFFHLGHIVAVQTMIEQREDALLLHALARVDSISPGLVICKESIRFDFPLHKLTEL